MPLPAHWVLSPQIGMSRSAQKTGSTTPVTAHLPHQTLTREPGQNAMSTSSLPTKEMRMLLRDLGIDTSDRPLRLVLEPRVVFDGAGAVLATEVLLAPDSPVASETETVSSSDHVDLMHALDGSNAMS